jgi:putative endonuclease
MYNVYAIKSINKSWIYVGMTDNLNRRILQHQTGANKSTKPYLPFILFYSETANTSLEARAREIYFKTAAGKRKLYKIFEAFVAANDGPV